MRSNIVPIVFHVNPSFEDVERKENKVMNLICKRRINQAIKRKEVNNKDFIFFITSSELYAIKKKTNKRK